VLLPQLAEIVLIAEGAVAAQAQVAEANLLRVVSKADTPWLGDTIGLAIDHESVEMAVGPAEGDLQHVMEVGDGSLAADEQPAPDRRADLDERDVKLVDFQVGRSVGYRVLPSSASITTRRAWHDEASMTPYC